MASLHPNPEGMDRWAEGKTNTSYHMYRGLNSCGIDNLSRICIRVFLCRPVVSHHDLDHLVEDHCSSPTFLSHLPRQPRLRLFATHCVWPMCLNAY
jgi:hypothetical protein